MTVAYFDTSALVKLFIEEPGSGDAAVLWDGADFVVTSRVADPEVRAALAAAVRARRLDARAQRAAKQRWAQYRAAIRIVELTAALAETAAELAESHALGALDAIHLASAMLLIDALPVLATWDERLLAAARSLGMMTLPASSPLDAD